MASRPTRKSCAGQAKLACWAFMRLQGGPEGLGYLAAPARACLQPSARMGLLEMGVTPAPLHTLKLLVAITQALPAP